MRGIIVVNKKRINIGIVFVLLMLCIYIATHYARENFLYRIQGVSQNALQWLDPKTQNTPLLTATKQQQLSAAYLKHYFSPWMHYNPAVLAEFKNIIRETISDYRIDPGYGINHLPNSVHWVDRIARNSDLAHFPNAHVKVITIANTNLRNLPTHQPSFGNFHQAGQGYPFDNLEVTSLAANTPAIVLQKTRDGAWSFILTGNTDGWVPTPTLATVDNQFMRHFKTVHYVTLIKNKIAVHDHNGLMRFTAGIGKIFPLINNNNHYSVFIAVPNANGKAVIKIATLNKTVAARWPIKATPYHIATIMNAMLGVKYGWGGIIGDSDCSLTVMNLFSDFGIYLPRNSTLQANAGRVIALKHLSNHEKEKIMVSHGIPFLTLLHMPGHIVVYIGQKKGRVMIFQTVWGEKTRNMLGKAGRAIIGTTVITPANLGERDVNVTQTWLDEMDKMIILE